MLQELVNELFKDLIKEYTIEIKVKSKRTFSIISIEDLPFELKEVVSQKVKTISEKLGRKSFIIDNPRVFTQNERYKITGGIWDIRIL
jgi:hypothetical protein